MPDVLEWVTVRRTGWLLQNSHSVSFQKRHSCEGAETAKLTGCFVSRAHSRYIWSFYRHNKNRYMKKVKADQAYELKNMTLCLLQNTRNFQHICTRSPILFVTEASMDPSPCPPPPPSECCDYVNMVELFYVHMSRYNTS